MIIRPAIFDRDILALDIAGFIQALTERGREGHIARSCRAVEKPDHRHRRLLRARRERPRGRRGTKQRDELASPHAVPPLNCTDNAWDCSYSLSMSIPHHGHDDQYGSELLGGPWERTGKCSELPDSLP